MRSRSITDWIVPARALSWGFLDGYLPPAPEGMTWGGWASRDYGGVKLGPKLEWPMLKLEPVTYRFGQELRHIQGAWCVPGVVKRPTSEILGDFDCDRPDLGR